MNPNALDRTAAWLLNMNMMLEDESIEPDFKHRDNMRNKEEMTQIEKFHVHNTRETLWRLVSNR